MTFSHAQIDQSQIPRFLMLLESQPFRDFNVAATQVLVFIPWGQVGPPLW